MQAAAKPLRAAIAVHPLIAWRSPLPCPCPPPPPLKSQAGRRDNPIFSGAAGRAALPFHPRSSAFRPRRRRALADIRVWRSCATGIPAQGRRDGRGGDGRSHAAALRAQETALLRRVARYRRLSGGHPEQHRRQASPAPAVAALRAPMIPARPPTPWNYVTRKVRRWRGAVAVNAVRNSVTVVLWPLARPCADVAGLVWRCSRWAQARARDSALRQLRQRPLRRSAHRPPPMNMTASGACSSAKSSARLSGVPIRAGGRAVLSTPEHHTLIVARTRTGKGTRVIVPTLLRYGGSAIVIDPRAKTPPSPRGRGSALPAPCMSSTRGANSRTHSGSAALRPRPSIHWTCWCATTPTPSPWLEGACGAVCPSPPGDKDRVLDGQRGQRADRRALWITDQPGAKTLARAREIVSLSRKDFTDRFWCPWRPAAPSAGAIREMVSPYLDLAQRNL